MSDVVSVTQSSFRGWCIVDLQDRHSLRMAANIAKPLLRHVRDVGGDAPGFVAGE
jgi:hypothetical protein